MSTTPTWIGLRLDPLDTLFFRDGRPFDAATRASGGLPSPQTLAGAIRTALLARTGFDFAKFAHARKGQDVRVALLDGKADPAVVYASFRGPWLALADGESGPASPLFPMPETLKRAKPDTGERWSVARPTPAKDVPGWDDPDGLLPLWRAVEADPKGDTLLLKMNGMQKFLEGSAKHIDSTADCVKREGLTAADHRVGIEIHKDTLTSADGMLYVISLLATKPKYDGQTVCLYAEIELPEDLKATIDGQLVPFGGEGRYVRVTTCDAALSPLAKGPTSGPAMWYLATPTFFPPVGRPLPNVAGLKAAASGAGVPVSGWDVARNGPRATRFAVPAGACYFVAGPAKPDDFLNSGNESDSKDLRQEGWGFALPGTWEGLPK